jgi:hypothetical protein
MATGTLALYSPKEAYPDAPTYELPEGQLHWAYSVQSKV